MTPEAEIAVLKAKFENLSEDYKELRVNMDAAGKRLTALERYAQWFIGAAAAAGLVIGVFSDFLKNKLGLA